jgi:phosphopantetheinyl transferase
MATELHAPPHGGEVVDALLEGVALTWADAHTTVRCFSRARSRARASDLQRALPDGERRAIDAIRAPERREARALGRGLLRCVLTAETGGAVAPTDWHFVAGPWGKPAAVGPVPAPSFSVTYGDEVMAVATSRTHDLGVDLEPVEPVRTADIPWPQLCEREQVVLRGLAGGERYERFVRMWTLKEAFTKCLGVGASLDFAWVETAFAPPRVKSRPTDAARGREFGFLQQRATIDGRRHFLALAASPRA